MADAEAPRQPKRRLSDEERDDRVAAIEVIADQLGWNVTEMRGNVDFILRCVRELRKH